MGLAEAKRNSEEGERMHDPTRRYAGSTVSSSRGTYPKGHWTKGQW